MCCRQKADRHVLTAWEVETVAILQNITDNAFELDVPRDLLMIVAAFARMNLRWDSNNCGDGYRILEHAPSVLCQIANQGWQIAVAEEIFEAGRTHSFSIKISEVGHINHASIGVVPHSCKANTSKNWMIGWPSAGGWEWWNGSGMRRSGALFASYGQTLSIWKAGDVVTVVVDFSAQTMERSGLGTISFGVNDVTVGIAFNNVVPPVKPAACTYSNGYSLEITEMSSN